MAAAVSSSPALTSYQLLELIEMNIMNTADLNAGLARLNSMVENGLTLSDDPTILSLEQRTKIFYTFENIAKLNLAALYHDSRSFGICILTAYPSHPSDLSKETYAPIYCKLFNQGFFTDFPQARKILTDRLFSDASRPNLMRDLMSYMLLMPSLPLNSNLVIFKTLVDCAQPFPEIKMNILDPLFREIFPRFLSNGREAEITKICIRNNIFLDSKSMLEYSEHLLLELNNRIEPNQLIDTSEKILSLQYITQNPAFQEIEESLAETWKSSEVTSNEWYDDIESEKEVYDRHAKSFCKELKGTLNELGLIPVLHKFYLTPIEGASSDFKISSLLYLFIKNHKIW